MLIPSIDLYDGKAVQWRQGREPVLERMDVFQLLEDFSLFGEVAVVDLNAATGNGSNRSLIETMLREKPCRVGGGIRDLETARAYLKAGARKIIVGSAAREAFIRKIPRDGLILALDSKGDHWLREGWREETSERTETLLDELAPLASEFLYTQVEKEGMLAGIDRERVSRVVKRSPIPVTVAGGITSLDDIDFLRNLGTNAQIGMAVYTGRLSLTDCMLASVNFDKVSLVPTIVQDAERGDVLMLAYSNRDSLQRALQERRGIYYSRSRNQIWRKGDSSGHTQELRRVDTDCDGDTLLFQVKQRGPACHLQRHSCFASVAPQFDLGALDRVLAGRFEDRPRESYTARLYADPGLRAAKLREETEELIAAEAFEDVRWEAADLLYFTLTQAHARGVGLDDIIAELRSRHGND